MRFIKRTKIDALSHTSIGDLFTSGWKINKRGAFIALCFCIMFMKVQSSHGQSMMAGHAQFCDVPIIVTPNPRVASAAIDENGNPVIYIDPGSMANWATSKDFTIAHECGHHMLGHSLPQGMWFRKFTFWGTKQQELDADCWAAQRLVGTLDIKEVQRTILQFESHGAAPQGTYPSGKERAAMIAQCAGISLLPPATTCATPNGVCFVSSQLHGSPCSCLLDTGPTGGVAE